MFKKNKPINARTPVLGLDNDDNGGNGTAAVYTAGARDFESILNEYLSAYKPQLIDYKPADEKTLSEQLAAWLRPIFEQSIKNRERQTDKANAALDADAISRGMGSSTFVSDMKNRNAALEAQDIMDIEGEYGSQLAKNLFDALEEDRNRQLEADKFNAQAQNEAYQRAFAAAEQLYSTYLSSQGSGGGGGDKGNNKPNLSDIVAQMAAGMQQNDPKLSSDDVQLYLSILSEDEKKRLNGAYDLASVRDRYNIINSIGPNGWRNTLN